MIELKQIVKVQGDRPILNHIDAVFSDKQHYVIFGESGSGKTTLLNLIAGYEQADEGIIEIGHKARVEYLYQEPLLFSNISVRENMFIKWIGQHQNGKQNEFEEESKHALEVFSIDQFYDRKIYSLSGGEKRRVELAQLFLSKPNILLLDEPTANLDHENKKVIIEVIQKNFKDMIILLVSHDDKSYFKSHIFLKLGEGKLSYE